MTRSPSRYCSPAFPFVAARKWPSAISAACVQVFVPKPLGSRGSLPRTRRARLRPSWPVSWGPNTAAGGTNVSGSPAPISPNASRWAPTLDPTYGSTRPMFSLRAIDKMLRVPSTFTSCILAASRIPSSSQPAMWNTTSARAMAPWNVGRVTSPATTDAPRGRNSSARAGSRVRIVTAQSFRRRASTRARPISPVPPVTKARMPSPFSEDDGQDVGIPQRVVEADLLPRELGGRPPDVRVPEAPAPIPVDRVAHHADVGAGLDDEGLGEIRLLPLRLEEHPHEPEGLVDLVPEAGQADVLLRGDRYDLPPRQLRLKALHVIRTDEVDLVHDDERAHVDAVPREDVDELVLRDVLPHDDRPVQVSPFPADVGDQSLVQLRQLDRRVHGQAAAIRLRQGDVRGPLVQADAGQGELLDEHVDVGLEDVDHEQDEVAAAGDGQDLLAAASALRRPADQAGHVEDLDLRAAVLEESWDHVEGREVVRRHGALRVRDVIEER